MLFTIDASVFVSSCNKNETSHDDSNAFLRLVKRTETLIVEPSLMPVEVAAAIRRGCGNNQLAVEYSEHLFKLPHAIFISLDKEQLNRAPSSLKTCSPKEARKYFPK